MRKNYNIREGLKILKDKEPVEELMTIARKHPLFVTSTFEEMLDALGDVSIRKLEKRLREKRLGVEKKVSEIEKGIERIQKEEDISELSFHKDEFKKPPRGRKLKEEIGEDTSLKKLKKRAEKIKEKKVEPEEKVKKIKTSRQRRMKAVSVENEEDKAEKVKEKFKKETKKKVKKFKKDKGKGKDKEAEVDDYFDEMFGDEAEKEEEA